jgi:hypothetical protein
MQRLAGAFGSNGGGFVLAVESELRSPSVFYRNLNFSGLGAVDTSRRKWVSKSYVPNLAGDSGRQDRNLSSRTCDYAVLGWVCGGVAVDWLPCLNVYSSGVFRVRRPSTRGHVQRLIAELFQVRC